MPAAGAGSRLNADQPKPLVPIAGRPMLEHVVSLYTPHVDRIVIVANPSAIDAMQAWRGARDYISIAQQPSPTGMLDAVLIGAESATRWDPREVWISWADQVGVLPATLTALTALTAQTPPPPLVFPTVHRSDPYIHFERDAEGRIVRLLQRREDDRMPREGESDIGVFALRGMTAKRELLEFAGLDVRGGATGERNFLPFIPWLAARATVVTFPCSDWREAIGVNTRDEQRLMEQWLQTR